MDADYVRLFEILTTEGTRGPVICPLSFWVFNELLKQNDRSTRQATAVLIDKLSNGVAFMPHGELVGQEILHFVRKTSQRYRNIEQWPIRQCIWTRTASFLGDRIPVWPDTIPKREQLVVQKYFEDFHFFMPLESMIERSDSVVLD